MEKIHLTINKMPIHCPPGTSILEAAKENGIKIPTLCNHPHLKPSGACRLCLVEEERSGHVLASCVTPVSPEMAIRTDTPAVIRYRGDIIRLMIANHAESCILCNKGNRCELRQVAADLGVGVTNLYPMPRYKGLEDANPFIIRDLGKCILCGRCIRADHELVQVGAIDYSLRGFNALPTAVHGLPLEKSSCTFCGTCVSMCPTGALMTKNRNLVGSPRKESSTICGFCGVGCSLLMGSVDGRVVEVNPSHRDDTVNLSTCCVRGHFAHDYLNMPERLTNPIIRTDDMFAHVPWEEALDLVTERLIAIRKENGPQSVAFLGSSKCSNEENYLFQKMARVFFETNNIDNGGYLSGRPGILRLNERLDRGNPVRSLRDLEKAELIFVLGADPLQSAPVAGYYIKRASRVNHVPLIVADPRNTELSPFASLWLPATPGSDHELINGMAALLYSRNSHNSEFIKKYTSDFEIYSKGLVDFDLDRTARITEIDRGLIEKAASLMEGKRTAFIVGHGILQQRHAMATIDALVDLALMTGNLGPDGGGIYLLSRENNQSGSLDMGSVPDYLPGLGPLKDPMIRRQWQTVWDVMISPDPGLDMARMIEEAGKGNLKALFVMGENPIRSLPQHKLVKEALEKLDFLVVQDILDSETTRIADVVLPGAAFSEKEGSFTNMEGRIQFFIPVVHPPGEARPDWMILDQLMEKMGSSRRYESIEKIRSEISRLVPMYGDLEGHGEAAWVRETSRMKLFNRNGTGELIPFSGIQYLETWTLKKAYPLKAIIGSSRHHLGSGTRTALSGRLRDFAPKGEAVISIRDAERLGLKEGDEARISSRHGMISRVIKPGKGIKEGIVFIPIAYNNNEVVDLMDLAETGETGSVGMKCCEVRIERIGRNPDDRTQRERTEAIK